MIKYYGQQKKTCSVGSQVSTSIALFPKRLQCSGMCREIGTDVGCAMYGKIKGMALMPVGSNEPSKLDFKINLCRR